MGADGKVRGIGNEDGAYPRILSIPAEANTLYDGGHVGGRNAAGNAAEDLACVEVWGIIDNRTDNRTVAGGNPNPGYGVAGNIDVPIKPGVFMFAGDATISATTKGYVFLKSGKTSAAEAIITTNDAGGTLPLLGFLVPFSAVAGTPDTGLWAVAIGMARPDAANPELSQSASTARKARLVVTSLSASYTGSGTGVLTGPATTPWPTQDGITNANQAIGDVVFIQEGTANLIGAVDAGPWTIAALAASSGSWSLVRPDWWANGGPIVPATVIEVGGDGTGTTPRFAGSDWKTFAGKGKVIGTDAPLFWPRFLSASYTATAGVVNNGAITTFPIRSITTSQAEASNQGTATHASTVGQPRVTAITAGVTGASSLTMKAESAPGTTNASDVGVYTVGVTNW